MLLTGTRNSDVSMTMHQCFTAEHHILSRVRELAAENKVWRSYIGQGYHNVRMPTTIGRNMLENPGWLVLNERINEFKI